MSLYDPRIGSQRVLNDSEVDDIFDSQSKEKTYYSCLKSFEWIWKNFPETKFGMIPFGSVLSYQCSLVPADFNVYSNLPTVNVILIIYRFQISYLVTLKITSNYTLIKLRMQVKWAYQINSS